MYYSNCNNSTYEKKSLALSETRELSLCPTRRSRNTIIYMKKRPKKSSRTEVENWRY